MPLEPGDPLPDAEALLCDGETFRPRRLEELVGDRGLVVSLFGFCYSAIARNWWKRYERYGWGGAADDDGERNVGDDGVDWSGVPVVGAGRDGPYATNAFLRAIDSPFRVLADVDGAIADGFGVRRDRDGWPDASSARRAVYVADADGVVTERWLAEDDISPQDVDAILDAVASLG
jgi:hypothetical protein